MIFLLIIFPLQLNMKLKVKVTQSCLTLWNPMDYTNHGILQNTGLGSFSLLQGIFLTQELNQGLPHCRQILYQLSYEGSPATWYGLQEFGATKFLVSLSLVSLVPCQWSPNLISIPSPFSRLAQYWSFYLECSFSHLLPDWFLPVFLRS